MNKPVSSAMPTLTTASTMTTMTTIPTTFRSKRPNLVNQSAHANGMGKHSFLESEEQHHARETKGKGVSTEKKSFMKRAPFIDSLSRKN